jgi:hypothetical protein
MARRIDQLITVRAVGLRKLADLKVRRWYLQNRPRPEE